MDAKAMITDYETYLNSLEADEQAAIACHLTDLGNGKRLALHFGHRLRYCHDTNKWLAFDGHRWNEQTGDEQAKRCAKDTALGIYDEARIRPNESERRETAKWAISSERDARINAMLSMAQSEKPISTYSKYFDTDAYAFNSLDWCINLRNSGVSPQQPEHFMTKLGGSKFDETATCPTWERCVNEWMDEDIEKVDYLQRLLGLCLTGDTCARVFPIFHGPGFNGKSVCVDTVLEILGDYGAVGSEDLLAEKNMSQHPCDIIDLKGKRLVVVDETKRGMKLRTSLVKRMTGDKKLKGRYMRQNFEEFEVTHKVILMTQNLPNINETSDAIWDRVHLLKWPVQFPPEKRDLDLRDKLRAEHPGILNWLIKGCRKWQDDGRRLLRPKSVQTATQEYRDESDPLAEYVEERCRLAENLTTPKKVLRADYEKWVDDNKEYKFSPQNFNAYLRERGAVDIQIKINSYNTKCWRGIGLRENLN